MEHGKPQKQALAIAYAIKRRNMAKGGDVGVQRAYDTTRSDEGRGSGTSEAGMHVRGANMAKEAGQTVAEPARKMMAIRSHQKTLSEMESMRGQTRQNLAEGGEACQACRGGNCMEHGGDIVDRVMRRMSEGGEIANDGELERADEQTAQFDDLVERDDLAEHYTGANSGDELGHPSEVTNEDEDDMVERILKRMRQTMPRTGQPGYPE